MIIYLKLLYIQWNTKKKLKISSYFLINDKIRYINIKFLPMQTQKNSKPIVLLTDFGFKDPYVGLMKGKILKIWPKAPLVDLCHEVNPYEILQGLFFLYTSYTYFPDHSIFLSVIDPGVGSSRKPLICKLKNQYFIAPDNGLLSPFMDEGDFYEIDITLFKSISFTFHGRDIFAPAAALLAKGSSIHKIAKKIVSNKLVKINYLPDENENEVKGKIFSIDVFGNIITNIENKFYEVIEKIILINNKEEYKIKKKVNTFSCLKIGDLGFIQGSHGYIEIISNMKSAKNILKIASYFSKIIIQGEKNGRN